MIFSHFVCVFLIAITKRIPTQNTICFVLSVIGYSIVICVRSLDKYTNIIKCLQNILWKFLCAVLGLHAISARTHIEIKFEWLFLKGYLIRIRTQPFNDTDWP